MDLKFLGTAASEAIPSVFCRCGYCSRARKAGGKDIRTRSSFRIDGRHQIDFSPDIFGQMTGHGLDLFDLQHLLITHSHEDHFDMAEILARDCAIPQSSKPLYIYLNKNGAAWAKNLIMTYLPENNEQVIASFMNNYRLIPVDYYETFMAGDLEVTSVKANHKAFGLNEYGQNYIIQLKDNRRLLYATDTGWYGEETWEFLKGKKADIVIMEATFGGCLDRGIHPNGHLDVRSMLLMLERMDSIGFIDSTAKIFATHINHKHDLMHEDLQAVFDKSKYKVIVAYDGLVIK